MYNDNKDTGFFVCVATGVVAVGLVIAAIVAVATGGLVFNRVAAPFAEETRAQTYDKSRAYSQGTQRDLARYCREYRATLGPSRNAVAELIRDTAATYQGDLTPANKNCLLEIGQ